MSKIEKFEDIVAWQKARELCGEIFELVNIEKFSRDFKLVDQINGSSGSVMDNIAEGFDRGGNKEFINFLSYSRGSNGEVRSQLYRALDRNYISRETFDRVYALSDETGRLITGLMNYLSQSDLKGFKFKGR